jgi:SAM-dependent methyltransferase
VAGYERSHASADFNYKVWYREYFIIDNLLESPYSALIAGCGTLGAPLRLLTGASRIVGVDRSAKMLAAAQRLSERAGARNVQFVQDDISAFPSACAERFDFIELGVMGTYLPFDVALLEAYAGLLNHRGLLLLLVTVIPPASLRNRGDPFRIKSPVASVASSLLFMLTGSAKHRVSTSLYAVGRGLDRWLAARALHRPSGDISLLYESVQRNGSEPPVSYRALLQKSGA